MGKIHVKFNGRSVVQDVDEIDSFIPPNPGWNYVEVQDHPLDTPYSHEYTGKWLLFVPDSDFITVFRRLAKLTAGLELTRSFKAAGLSEKDGNHVFCVYCNSADIPFVRKIAETLDNEGYLEKYGYKYRDGSKAVYFKTEEATHYESRSRGMSLTLFRYNTRKELSVKEFNKNGPEWKPLDKHENDSTIIDNFRSYLDYLSFSEDD
jgi:hypothetical protein